MTRQFVRVKNTTQQNNFWLHLVQKVHRTKQKKAKQGNKCNNFFESTHNKITPNYIGFSTTHQRTKCHDQTAGQSNARAVALGVTSSRQPAHTHLSYAGAGDP